MKKLITLTLAAAAVLCLWGCGRKDPAPETETNAPATTAPTQAPTVTMPDPTVETNIPDPTVDSNSTENGSLIDDITEMTNGG